MRVDVQDCNFESMVSKLAKGSIDEKSHSLKKLLYLYDNSRSRIYLYERRITQNLQLALLIEQKDISLSALTLLEKIINNLSPQSDLAFIIRKRHLGKVVLNLGSIEIGIRKISHKCILEYVRKFKDHDSVTTAYLKTAIHQHENVHLKLKAINSYHSLMMTESRYFSHHCEVSKMLLEQLIHSSFQKQYTQIRRAALLCLLFVLRIRGAQNNLNSLNKQNQQMLNQLRGESQELSSLLDLLLKGGQIDIHILEKEDSSEENNAPSPKFISIQETEELKTSTQGINEPRISEGQLKIFNEVSFAEEFLKRLEKTEVLEFDAVKDIAPFLEKCLIDESIKLFSISKKIVEVIFNSEEGKKKPFYLVLVPCIVNGIGNRRLIVRKNLDKLARQYIKNHTDIWVKNFIDRLATTKNCKVKDVIIQLLMHAYRTSPQFYFPTNKIFEVLDMEMSDSSSVIKRKVIDCVVIILERQKDQKNIEQMLKLFSAEPYQKIIRKIGYSNKQIEPYSELGQIPTIQPISPIVFKKHRKNRLVTAEPEKTYQKSQGRPQNVSQQKVKLKDLVIPYRGKVRNSHIEINFKLKKSDRRSREEKQRNSLQKLPELKKNYRHSGSKHEGNQSPVKKLIIEKNMFYHDKDNLKPLQNPKTQLENAMIDLKDSNWNIQFESISKIRSIIYYNKDLVNEDSLTVIVNELLHCISNQRSGVTKLALLCLYEIIPKFCKKMNHLTQNIVLILLKKSIAVPQFLQDDLKRCIIISTQNLCLSKLISTLTSMKDSKSNQIKITLLLFLESMLKNEKTYKKQHQWIWITLTDFHDEPNFHIRNQCRRLMKILLETHKDWKNQAILLKKSITDKIEKILKSLNTKGQNRWIEQQNQQFQKVLVSKIINAKYFTNYYSKFQETDRNLTLKKNWKEKIKLLSEMFHLAFEHSHQFQNSSNARKYIYLAIEQIDEKNPGLLVNSLSILHKSVDYFPSIVEDCLPSIIQRSLGVVQSKRGQLAAVATKMLNKVHQKFDINKTIKEYIKISTSSSKLKTEALLQLIPLIKQLDTSQLKQSSNERSGNEQNIKLSNHNNSIQNLLVKALIKICNDKNLIENSICLKLKELVRICNKKFGEEFMVKINNNDRLMEFIS